MQSHWVLNSTYEFGEGHIKSITLPKGNENLSVQSLSCVRLFATPWPAARQASLFITNSPELGQTHVH